MQESACRAALDRADAQPLLEIVRGLWEQLGFLSIAKLRAELDPNRRERGSGKRQASRWSLAVAVRKHVRKRRSEGSSSFALATPYHLKELSKTAQPQQNHQPTHQQPTNISLTLGGVGERASVPHEKPKSIRLSRPVEPRTSAPRRRHATRSLLPMAARRR